jgi:signal transduction histidine kinase
MSLRGKLILGFAAVGLVLLVPSLFAATRLAQLKELAVEGRSGHAAAVAGIGRMQALLAELNRVQRSFIATGDSALGAAAESAVDSLRAVQARFASSPYGEVGAALEQVVVDVAERSERIATSMREGLVTEATMELQPLISRLGTADAQLAAVAAGVDALARQEIVRADQMTESARVQTLVAVVLAFLWSVVLASLITHALTSPLRRLSRGMAHVADGGFETPSDLPYDRRDEVGELSTSFRTMARRLAELDRVKSEFFGIVSHELKTPLNAIRAYAEVLQDELGDRASDFHRTLLSDVMEQTQVMGRRVSRLMDISRLSAGTYQIAPEHVQIDPFAAQLRSAWELRAHDHRVCFEVLVRPSAPLGVVMDVEIVRDEVIGNLVSNAIRHTPPFGRVDVVITGDERGVVFTVTDTGPGIPEEHRELVFRKHYTVDRRSVVGSGLGLAIAKEMAELHGGIIQLERSPPGCGARFSVALPLVPRGADMEVPSPHLIGAAAQPSPSPVPTERDEKSQAAKGPRESAA